jgi:glutaminyl-peptide cyclotransferase
MRLSAPRRATGSRAVGNPPSAAPASPRRRLARPAIVLAAAAALGILGVAVWALFAERGATATALAALPPRGLDEIPFNGRRAYESLKQLCAIGPRPSGSPGMEAQQKLLVEHFQKLHGQVELQRFRAKHPHENADVHMANIVVHWEPEKKDRILLCAHYDTLPYPLLDPQNPRGRFVGANDNASGVAILMELAHDMPTLRCQYGVDFLLLDGEEYVFDPDHDPFFLGSQYFAEQYAKNPPPYHYRWGVLLDMVGATGLQIYQERNSLGWRDTRPLVSSIWATAARLGVREFVAKPKHEIRDDHLMLHEVGRIPCIDIIDFDYPPWHTQGDVPERCAALSLAKVGWVLEEWLKTVK